MAGRATPGLKPLAALLLAAGMAAAQTTVSLEQVERRHMPEFAPALLGQTVVVGGRVSTHPVSFWAYSHLGIQDGSHGLVLEGRPEQFAGLRPGDDVRVTGRVAARGGLPVVVPDAISVSGHGPPPVPQVLGMEALRGFRYLGRLVRTEGQVLETGENTGGLYVILGTDNAPYKIFIPFSPGKTNLNLGSLGVGDTVEVTGIASQYCSVPPYNRWFQVIASDASAIRVVEKNWLVPRSGLLMAAILIGLICLFWLSREGRLRSQREVMRRAYQLGEEVLGSTSLDEIHKRLCAVLPKIFRIGGVQLYMLNRGARGLEPVRAPGEPEPRLIPLANPPNGPQAGAVACFHYRTLLAIPDTARSPFPVVPAAGARAPRSLLFVPMFAQGEVIGVLELSERKTIREFTADEQALAQHLGNQIGVAVRLLEQRSVREQLYRTEKLAAVGKLISGVVNELQAPLANIRELAAGMTAASGRALAAIESEARAASDIVARLVSFASAEQVQARPVDVNRLLRNLIEFRDREWKAQGIKVRDMLTHEPLYVLGSHGQLEQVFLNMLVHAEQALAEASERVISLRSSLVGARVLLEIGYNGPRDVSNPFARWSEETSSAAGLGVVRGIIAGHGGEVRMVQALGAEPRFEVELPSAPRERSTPAAAATAQLPPPQAAGQRLTVLLIEPDEQTERHLLAVLSARGYRVVPVHNSDAGLDVAQRLRFDAVLCSVRAPGLNWVELSEQLQSRVGVFVLLAETYDAELIEDFESESRFVLAKPFEERELERVLRQLEGEPIRADAPGR